MDISPLVLTLQVFFRPVVYDSDPVVSAFRRSGGVSGPWVYHGDLSPSRNTLWGVTVLPIRTRQRPATVVWVVTMVDYLQPSVSLGVEREVWWSLSLSFLVVRNDLYSRGVIEVGLIWTSQYHNSSRLLQNFTFYNPNFFVFLNPSLSVFT